MGLTATEPKDGGNKNLNPVPQGLHHGVCYAIYDLGTQYMEFFDKYAHKVIITWELPNERIKIERDGNIEDLPRVISKEYTLSLHKKATLRQDLETWKGSALTDEQLSGFNLKNLLNQNCTLQIMHPPKKEDSDRVYPKVNAIMPLMKDEASKPENPTVFFSFEDGYAIPDTVPSWIVDKIKASKEWSAHEGGMNTKFDNTNDDMAISIPKDDIPF